MPKEPSTSIKIRKVILSRTCCLGQKERLISKHKQIKTSNTQSWFYSNHHTDSTAHRGYTTHPTLGVLGLMQSSEFSSGVAMSLVVVRWNNLGWAWRFFNNFLPVEVMGWRWLLVTGIDLVFYCLLNHDDPFLSSKPSMVPGRQSFMQWHYQGIIEVHHVGYVDDNIDTKSGGWGEPFSCSLWWGGPNG